MRVSGALSAEPGAGWHEHERPQTGGFGWRSDARREGPSRPCRLLLLLRAPAPAPASPRGAARFLTAPAASRSSPGSRCYAPPGRRPAGIRGLSSCSQRGPAPRLCRREPLRAARPSLGTAPELRAPKCCTGPLSHGVATPSCAFSLEKTCQDLTLCCSPSGDGSREWPSLWDHIAPGSAGRNTEPCTGTAVMFELPRCSGAVPCWAVPFQLDPHGSADMGNALAVHGSLVAQTAVVVARRSV